jgi:hypothetical protein
MNTAKIKKIISISPNNKKRYDIEVQHSHCFFANGILVHNSSSHISWKNQQPAFFAGGEKEENFRKMFDIPVLIEKFKSLLLSYPITVYGECYGGRMQGMSKTYGTTLKFIAFEVKIGENWLCVPEAEKIAIQLGIEFVHYRIIPTTIEVIDAEILLDSIQAVRNGLGEGHKREGVVLRPMIELTKNNGARIIAKHKREDFQETKSKRPLDIDPERLKILDQADKIAEEWVTANRLEHILQQISGEHDIRACGQIAKLMVEDVLREGVNEIVDSKEARKAISRKAIELFKDKICKLT